MPAKAVAWIRRFVEQELGEHLTLLFEDELTIRYQVQEMLRIERIFEEDGIQHELDAYNPLVPDGSNWKATMLIQYPDADERKRMLARLKGIERRQILQAAEELGYDASKVRKWVNQKYEVTGGLGSLTAHDKREVLKIFRERAGA